VIEKDFFGDLPFSIFLKRANDHRVRGSQAAHPMSAASRGER